MAYFYFMCMKSVRFYYCENSQCFLLVKRVLSS